MDKAFCKCCEHFSITQGSGSSEENILCKKHNTVCAVTTENLHSSCPDFKSRNDVGIIAKAMAFGAFVSGIADYSEQVEGKDDEI